jgi:hypothetical protein
MIKAAAHQDRRHQDSCLALHEVKKNIADPQASGKGICKEEEPMPKEALDEARTATIMVEVGSA